MTSANQPGTPACYVNLAGTSNHPHGGRDLPQPRPANRRVQVLVTDHPSNDRWIVLRTVRLAPTPLFEVGVLDGHNIPTAPLTTYPTYERARRAANRLYRAMTEEN